MPKSPEPAVPAVIPGQAPRPWHGRAIERAENTGDSMTGSNPIAASWLILCLSAGCSLGPSNEELNRVHPLLWDPAALWVLSQPAAIVLLVLALLLWIIGYKRRPFAGRFTA